MTRKAFSKQFRECKKDGTAKTISIDIVAVAPAVAGKSGAYPKAHKCSIIICTKYNEQCRSSLCKSGRCHQWFDGGDDSD